MALTLRPRRSTATVRGWECFSLRGEVGRPRVCEARTTLGLAKPLSSLSTFLNEPQLEANDSVDSCSSCCNLSGGTASRAGDKQSSGLWSLAVLEAELVSVYR